MAKDKNAGMYVVLWLLLLGAAGVSIAGLVIALDNKKKIENDEKESFCSSCGIF